MDDMESVLTPCVIVKIDLGGGRVHIQGVALPKGSGDSFDDAFKVAVPVIAESLSWLDGATKP